MSRAAQDKDVAALEKANEAETMIVRDELAAQEGHWNSRDEDLSPSVVLSKEEHPQDEATGKTPPSKKRATIGSLEDIGVSIVEEDEESSGSDDESLDVEKPLPSLGSTNHTTVRKSIISRLKINTDASAMRRIVSVYGADLDISEKKLKRRSTIIEEIIHTEESYITDLEVLLDLFIRPLTRSSVDEVKNRRGSMSDYASAAEATIAESATIIKDSNIKHLFSCIPIIIKANTELLKALKDFSSMGKTVTGQSQYIGNTMLEMVPSLSGYTQYLSVFEPASSALHEARDSNRAFDKFLRSNEARGRCRTDFFSMLIMPVQRIPRYKLLVRELLSHTSPLHEDYDVLTMCMKAIGDMSSRINKACDDLEKTHRTQQVASLLNSASGLKVEIRIEDELLMDMKVHLVRIFNHPGIKIPPESKSRHPAEISQQKYEPAKMNHIMVVYKHIVILAYVSRIDHTWEILSVGNIDGTLSATLTQDGTLMLKWGGSDKYEVGGNDLSEIAEVIEDAHSNSMNLPKSRERRRTRSIAKSQQHPFWSPNYAKNLAGSNSSMKSKKSSSNLLHNLRQLKTSEKLHA